MSTFTVQSPTAGGYVRIGEQDVLISEPLCAKDLLLIVRCLEEHRNVTLLHKGRSITADKPDPLRTERLSIVSDAGTFVSFENTDNLVLRQIKKVLTDSFVKEGPVRQVMFVERDYDRACEQPICVSIEDIATGRYGQEQYRGIQISDLDQYMKDRLMLEDQNPGVTHLTKDEAIRLRDALTELIKQM